jgi:hypothetical protein
MEGLVRRNRRLSGGVVLGLIAGVGIGVSPGPVILLAVLLAPGILLSMIERRGRRGTAVLLFGAAGAVQPVLSLVREGLYLDTTWALLSDPLVLARAWLAGLLGWGLAQSLPELVLLVLNAQARTRVAALRRDRARLNEEWDL